MRWTATLIPTLKEAPSDAAAASHRLMLRAGMIRQVGSGVYTYLPLGLRALRRMTAIVREEMERAGAVEVLMPGLWPQELMDRAGRTEAFAEDLIRFTDRHGRPHVLAPTHEEVVTALVRDEVKSYRRLPIVIYQIQTKFRDEPRPRFGVIRAREFVMKDAYSFSMDEAGLDECYGRICAAYRRILERCGLDYVVAEADPGAMGGGRSHEFIVPAPVGTAEFVRCPGCGYAANLEIAAAAPPPPAPEPPQVEPELREVETPGQTTIEQVSRFLNAPPERMIKTLIYLADGRPVAALVRGEHELNEAKLRRALGAESVEPADAGTVEAVTGAPVGFAGPVGLEGVETVVDPAVAGIADAVAGANRADAHVVGVVPGRDFALDRVEDIRGVGPGDACARCGAELGGGQGIEVGHVFRLGTKYSEAFGARYLGPDGAEAPYVMGCYGFGVSRAVAAVIEAGADEHGIVWPPPVAPCEVLVMPLDMSEARVAEAAEQAYEALRAAGLEALLDDRDERPGVKFKDADLIGVPVRVVVGKGYLRSGRLEVQIRQDGSRGEVEPANLAQAARRALGSLAATVFTPEGAANPA